MAWTPVQSSKHQPGTPVLVLWHKKYLAAVVADPSGVKPKTDGKELEVSWKEVRCLGPLLRTARRSAASQHPSVRGIYPPGGGRGGIALSRAPCRCLHLTGQKQCPS